MGRPNFSTGNVIDPYEGLQNTVGSIADKYFKQQVLKDKARSDELEAVEKQRRWELQNARAEETLGMRRDELARVSTNRDLTKDYQVKATPDNLSREALESFSGGVGEYLSELPKTTLPGGGTVPTVPTDIGDRVQGGMDRLLTKEQVRGTVYNDILAQTGDSDLASKMAKNTSQPYVSRADLVASEKVRVDQKNKDLEDQKKKVKYDLKIRNEQQKFKSKGASSKYKPTNISNAIELYDKIGEIPVSLVNTPFSDVGTLQDLASKAVALKKATPTEAYAAVLGMVEPGKYGNNLYSSFNPGLDDNEAFVAALENVRSKASGKKLLGHTKEEQAVLDRTNITPSSFAQIQARLGATEASDRFNAPDTPKTNKVPATVIAGDLSSKLESADQRTLQNAQAMTESSGNPDAVSPVGARGLMQAMPDTAKQPGFNVRPMQDWSIPEQLRFGADYQKALEDKYGNRVEALMAYNWGTGNVDEWIKDGRKPDEVPEETSNYLSRIAKGLGGRDIIGELMGKAPKAIREEVSASPVDMGLERLRPYAEGIDSLFQAPKDLGEPYRDFKPFTRSTYEGNSSTPLENTGPILSIVGGAGLLARKLIPKAKELIIPSYKDIIREGLRKPKTDKDAEVLLKDLVRTSKQASPASKNTLDYIARREAVLQGNLRKASLKQSSKDNKGPDWDGIVRWKRIQDDLVPTYKP